MKKKLILLSLAILTVSFATWAWWTQRADQQGNTLVLHGNVDIRQISLAFDGSGRVARLHADEGDSVKAGALLAVLDTSTLALQAEEAQARLEMQRQTLLRLRNGARPQEIAQA